jgi:hypothetical protein
MATELKMTLLLRRAEFADSCILALGEPGYNTKTKEFKIGDGTTQWSELPIANKTQIEAIVNAAISAHAAGYYTKEEINAIKKALEDKDAELLGKINENTGAITAEATARSNKDTELQNAINTKLAEDTFNTWKGTHETDHAKTATEITTEITTAVNGEKDLREAADLAINNKIGGNFDATNTVAKAITDAESAAKSHAESKASAAQAAAIAEAENKDVARAQAAATALSNAVSALETKITNGDTATLNSANAYTDEKVAAEAKLREDADKEIDGRLDKIEAFFAGAAEDEGEGENLKNALDTLKEIQDFATGEGTAAQEMLTAIGQNANDIDALESRMGEAEGNITSLGSNKLDKSTYETYIAGKSMSDEDLKSYTDTAKSEAITEAGKLDTALHTVISKEIDDDVKAAIDAEVERANGAYDAKDSASTAKSEAITEAGRLDGVLKTAIEGTTGDASSAATIAGAKKYAEEKAATAEQNAKGYADSLAGNYDESGAADDALEAAKDYTDEREVEIKKYADQAEADAITAVVGNADSTADSDTIKGVRKALEAGDTATLTAAKAYADTVAANAVTNNIKAGNTDIVITRPDSGEDKDKTVISHKVYGSGTYTKPDSVSDANFVTGINVENGHVTGASVKSLAEALMAMEFIFDGGTSAN